MMEELSMHILDIVENSVRAGATMVTIEINESTSEDRLTVIIEDNGSGMDEETLRKALDPFYTTKTVRKVGLGIPLLAQAARAAGGDLAITSEVGKGTRIYADFQLSHIDRQPLGKMEDTIVSIIAGNPGMDFVYIHRRNGGTYQLDTRELREALEDVPINHGSVLSFIRDGVKEALAAMKVGSGIDLEHRAITDDP
ncbi:MAG: ATP-binding protein [Anaerovoracaceae bacterium]